MNDREALSRGISIHSKQPKSMLVRSLSIPDRILTWMNLSRDQSSTALQQNPLGPTHPIPKPMLVLPPQRARLPELTHPFADPAVKTPDPVATATTAAHITILHLARSPHPKKRHRIAPPILPTSLKPPMLEPPPRRRPIPIPHMRRQRTLSQTRTRTLRLRLLQSPLHLLRRQSQIPRCLYGALPRLRQKPPPATRHPAHLERPERRAAAARMPCLTLRGAELEHKWLLLCLRYAAPGPPVQHAGVLAHEHRRSTAIVHAGAGIGEFVSCGQRGGEEGEDLVGGFRAVFFVEGVVVVRVYFD